MVLTNPGCLFTPPIIEPPVELDGMFVIDPEDISPGIDTDDDGVTDLIGRIVLDRTLVQTQRFGVSAILDVDDLIAFEYTVFLLPSPFFSRQTGELRAAVEQEGGEYTVYEGPFFEFDPCAIEVATSDGVTIQLRFIDQIPEEQQAQLGRTEYTYDITWVVDLIEDCPLEEP
jgi:hypothetical protein